MHTKDIWECGVYLGLHTWGARAQGLKQSFVSLQDAPEQEVGYNTGIWNEDVPKAA